MAGSNSQPLGPWVHRILLGGATLSALLLIVGIPKTLLDRNAQGALPPGQLPRGLMGGLLEGQGEAIVQLGLLVLMATPVARIITLSLGWALLKDYRFMAVSLVVLALLLVSILSGAVG